MSTNADLSSILSNIRAIADKAKAAALAEVKSKNADLPTGHKLPSLVVANHAKATATAKQSAALIAALQSGALVVKGAGKILKSGDASIRIGAPMAALSVVVADAQAKALKSKEARMVTRFRVMFPAQTEGKADALVLQAAKMHAARVEAEKAAAKAAKETEGRKVERITPAGEAAPADELSSLLNSLELAAA